MSLIDPGCPDCRMTTAGCGRHTLLPFATGGATNFIPPFQRYDCDKCGGRQLDESHPTYKYCLRYINKRIDEVMERIAPDAGS